MKTKSKALLLTLCAALLVAASVLGTMAYLTDTASVENTFTVGRVALTLDEADVDENGQPLDKDGKVITNVADAPRVDKNEYHLIPGHSYTKDPIVHVDAVSEDSWIFVKVENGIAAYEDTTSTIASQITANGWTPVDGQTNVYYKSYTKSTTGANLPVFSSFKIAGTADKVSGWSAITAATTTVKVTAYAVQKDGFSTAAAAWTATFGA